MSAILSRHWKTLAALVVISPLGATAGFAIENNSQRTVFIGKTDPNSGYRYRLTGFSGWQVADESSPPHANIEDSSLSTQVQQWFRRNLFHLVPSRPLAISLSTYTPENLPGDIAMQDEDTEPLLDVDQRVVTHRHLQVDGCPATVCVLEQVGLGSSEDEIRLHVYVPNAALWYDIDAWTEESDPDQVTQHMQAIIASLHIEKVMGGKRSGTRP